MSILSIAINGTPIEEKRLRLAQGQPSVSGLNRARAFVAFPGRAGGVFAETSTVEPRVLRFELQTDRTVQANAEVRGLLDELRDLFDGFVEVTYALSASRRIAGVCRVFEGSVPSPSFLNTTTTLVVEVTCANAAFEDVEPSQRVLGSTPVAIPVGTVGHDGRFTITGPNTTPFTITYRNAAGRQLGALAITPALGTGERLLIDLASQQLAKMDSGGTLALVPSWDTGSTWFHVLPRDAHREMGAWPTLEASAAVLYEFRRHWEH